MVTSTETDAMKAIENALDDIKEDAARERVLAWAQSKYSVQKKLSSKEEPIVATTKKVRKAVKGQRSPSKKSKASLSIVKELNLSPKGKTSFADFMALKEPKSDQEKCAAAVFHLQRTLELPGITVNHVYTCYKIMKWRVPANLENTLTVMASQKGWIDTTNLKDIKITTHGENLIEHDLPKKKAK